MPVFCFFKYRGEVSDIPIIFTGVGGLTGTALNRVLPETTGKVINDLPTIWTQISTSGVNTAIPIMLSK